MKKYVEVAAAKEFASSFLADPIRKMAVNAVLENAPTVDAIEVVRCKDCKHYRHFKGCGNWCHRRLRSDIEFKVKPSDFCSYGERRG